MTQEEKQLLLKDLCGRLTTDIMVTIEWESDGMYLNGEMLDLMWSGKVNYKPYLRPMSSMTEEEKKEYNKTKDKIAVQWDNYGTPIGYEYSYTIKTFDYLIAHHFDYRGLIEKGLALEASEDMYK